MHPDAPSTTTVEHGGTDAGPAPVVDASTNANPYGPSPAAVAAVRGADVGPYPDPAGTATRAAIAEHHDLDPDEVVLGAGATELIDRLVRVLGGTVLTEPVTFGEYAGAAARHGVPHRTAAPETFAAAVGDAALAFVCSPGNPDGRVRDAAYGDEVAAAAARAGTTVVWDLAYAPLVTGTVPVPPDVVALHAPNKAHGCTGIRAGWLRAPAGLARRLRAAEVTWSVSAVGHAFLRTSATRAADDWVAAHAARLTEDRDALAADLRGLGLEVRHGEAPFVLVRAPESRTARALAEALRTTHAVKVRPTASMGLPGHLRIAALPEDRRAVLVDALRDVLERTNDRTPHGKVA